MTVTLKDSGAVKQVTTSDVEKTQDILDKAGIEYKLLDVPQDSWFTTILVPLLITFLGITVIFMFMNRQGGGANAKAMNFGKSRAKMTTDTDLSLIHI